MKRGRRWLAVLGRARSLLAACLLLATPAVADEAIWRQALRAGEAAYRRNDNADALLHFTLALKQAETFGEADPRLATTLSWAAEVYRLEGRLQEAEVLLKRTIAIRERLLGPNNMSTQLSRMHLELVQKALAAPPAPAQPATPPPPRQADVAPLKEPARPVEVVIAKPPEAAVAPKPAPKPEPPPAPIVVAKPEPKPEPPPAPIVVAKPEPKPEPPPAPIVVAKPEPKPEPPPAPIVVAKPEPKPEPPPAPVVVAKPEPKPEPPPAPIVVAKPEPKPEPPPAPIVVAKPEPKPEPPPAPIVVAKPEPKPEPPPAPIVVAKPEPKPEPPPAPIVLAKPEPKPAPPPPAPIVVAKPEPKPEPPPAPIVVAKPAPRPEPPPAPIVVAKPDPKSEPIVVARPEPAKPPPEKPAEAPAGDFFRRALGALALPEPAERKPEPPRPVLGFVEVKPAPQQPVAETRPVAPQSEPKPAPLPVVEATPKPAPPPTMQFVEAKPRPQPVVEPPREPIVVVKPAPKPEPPPAPVVIAKPEPKPEPPPAPIVVVKPEPKPAPLPPMQFVEAKPRPAPPPTIVAAPAPAPQEVPQREVVTRVEAPKPVVVPPVAVLAPAPAPKPAAPQPVTPRSQLAQFAGARNADAQRAFELVQLGRNPAATPAQGDHLNPSLLPLAAAQAMLAPDEALLSYLVDEQMSYLVAVRRDRAAVYALDIGRAQLEANVKLLRANLDPTSDIGPRGQTPTFPVPLAHQVYRSLVAPAEALLQGATQLLVVPDGALQSLPFAVLVALPPPPKGEKETPPPEWLAKRHAVTVLPAEGTLQSLRRTARAGAGTRPFGGFGDPSLRGEDRRAATPSVAVLSARGPSAQLEAIRGLTRLPETRYVLNAMADILNADAADVRVDAEASEEAVKKSDLSAYEVLAFATYGLMSGEFKDGAEPALVLSPPRFSSEEDDGLLTASEVAKLRLNADLVVLPASTTAASDGTPAADGLPRLSRAFLHAGGRSLLVSHWAVNADSTLKLVSRMLRERARGVGNAEALRRAMLALMNGEDQRAYTHPMYWAQFVIVGDGAPRAASGTAARR